MLVTRWRVYRHDPGHVLRTTFQTYEGAVDSARAAALAFGRTYCVRRVQIRVYP